MNEVIVTTKMPVLALRGLTVFPDQTVHFDVGRLKSAMALERAMKHDQTLFLVPQKDITEDDPGLRGLYAIGTVCCCGSWVLKAAAMLLMPLHKTPVSTFLRWRSFFAS